MLIRSKRPFFNRPALFSLIFLSFFLVACGTSLTNTNWPGLSTDGELVYLAHGTNILAYDPDAGTVVWSFPAPENAQASLSYYAAPSITADQIVVGDYGASAGFFSPGVVVTAYGLNHEGVEQWRQSGEASDAIVAPPLQVGEQTFVGTADGDLLALASDSGDLLWRFETGHSIWGQPTYKDGVLYIASLDKSVYALDANSGTAKWQTTLSGALPAKVVANTNLVYVASFDRQVHALEIATGEEAWAASAEDWVWGAPVLVDDALYFGDISGNVYAVNAQSGDLLWQESVEGAIQASFAVHNGVVYVASEGNLESGIGSLAAFSADSGEQLWQEDTPSPLYTSPIIRKETVVVAPFNNENLLLIGYDFTGKELWSLAPPATE